MIGRLAGLLLEKQAPGLMVDIGGVGYDLLAPMTTFYRLPECGEAVTLHTHFAVSETSQQLYGFITQADRELFRLLIKVNGVGPKMAVGIMSMESHDIVQCVRSDNISALVKVPGVGKKTAERLIIEMRDKLSAWQTSELVAQTDVTPAESEAKKGIKSQSGIIAEAESALVALGYKPVEAARAISAAMDEEVTRSEQLIRRALKSMLPA